MTKKVIFECTDIVDVTFFNNRLEGKIANAISLAIGLYKKWPVLTRV